MGKITHNGFSVKVAVGVGSNGEVVDVSLSLLCEASVFSRV